MPPVAFNPRGVAGRGTDEAVATDADRAIEPAARYAAAAEPRLGARDSAIVDEAFLRGASTDEVMQILFARALARSDTDAPAAPSGSTGRTPGRRFTLEDVYYLEQRDLTERQQRRLGEVEHLRPLVAGRFDAYVALANDEFEKLPEFVKSSFEPIRSGRYADATASKPDKYRRMRGAYYRAGWTSISRDILQLIVPAAFFGVRIIGGVHNEMAALLKLVEERVHATAPGVGEQVGSAGFVIGGFVPRFQGESDQLSNHAYGLAIDIDDMWNPQLKTRASIAALERATGQRLDVLLRPASSIDAIRKTHTRLATVSMKLKAWLSEWLPKYDQLQSERAGHKKDPRIKQTQALDNELRANPDLAALNVLITEYQRPTVEAWRAYGIVSIPAEIIEAFVALGRKNGARWGGEYEHTKDVMHLELLQLNAPDSLGRPGGAGRRAPVKGLDDLVRGDARPAQRLAEGRRWASLARPLVRPQVKSQPTKTMLRMDPMEIRGVIRPNANGIAPTPQPPPELDAMLDFLTGRSQKTPQPTDPPLDVPTNVQLDHHEVAIDRGTPAQRNSQTALLNNRLGNFPFTPPFGRIDRAKELPKTPWFDSSWTLEPEPPPNQLSIQGMVVEAWRLLGDSPRVRKWFKDNWSKDPFKSDITIAYTGKYGTDPYDWFALLHQDYTVYTNQWTGTITFTPRFKGRAAAREITAGLMHELNNWAARAAGSGKVDDYSAKGSYTAERLAYDVYDVAHPNWRHQTAPAAGSVAP